MDFSTRTTVVGVFDEVKQADRAISALHLAGFTDEQIGYIRRDGETAPGTTVIVNESPAHTGSGVGTGAVLGGLIGAAAVLLIPGVGPVLAGGILVHTVGATAVGAAVVGVVGGALTGGLLGALTGLGVPEDEARYADEQFQAGRTLVTVKGVGRAGEATEILQRYGAQDIHADHSGTPQTTPPGPIGATNDEPVIVVSTSSPYRENRV
jgi:hypothetical protein